MSGIAQLLAQKGYKISGSDLSFNENTQRLQKEGIRIILGHDPSRLNGTDVVVVSTDIKEDNLELQEARRLNLPIFHRADMLAFLMKDHQRIAISGTHGKTTTTALMGWALEKAGLGPTIINGGVMNAWESNVKVGGGRWCVVEADESDGSFLKLPRDMALVTNIDLEHMDYYGHFEKLWGAFEIFTTQFHSTGVAILGIDHLHVYALWQKIKTTQRCITYGFHPEAEVQAQNIRMTLEGTFFELINKGVHAEMFLPLYGPHNVLNALGVAAAAFECGLEQDILREAFASFQGVQRRFTRVGSWQGVTIIDDYAHHPVEIRATLAAAKNATEGRIIAVLEPHRYSRLASHFQDFATCCEEADLTIVLPVYAAREAPRDGVHHEALVSAMEGEVYRCDKPEQLPHLIQSLAKKGDMVICLGAGSISGLARALPTQLNQERGA